MTTKDAHFTDFKHPCYKKWKHNTLVEPELYRRCWKKHSLVFLDNPATHVIGILYVQHSTKFPEYGEHGFRVLRFALVNEDVSSYLDSMIVYMHLSYNNSYNIMWFPRYIWWYKSDDDSKELHNKLPYDTDGSNNMMYEVIDRGDIYVVKLIRNYGDNHPYANLRGRAFLQYLYKKNEEYNKLYGETI